MKVEKIGLEEMEMLYANHLVHDFPQNELKSFETIKKSFNNHQSECLVLKDNKKIMAYSVFAWKHPEVKILEYFAVTKENRGTGMGSLMISMLMDYLTVNELIIESEDPSISIDEKEKEINQKRLSFYRKNNFKESGLKLKLGDVHFIIFRYHNQLTNDELLEEIKAIYHITSPNMEILAY